MKQVVDRLVTQVEARALVGLILYHLLHMDTTPVSSCHVGFVGHMAYEVYAERQTICLDQSVVELKPANARLCSCVSSVAAASVGELTTAIMQSWPIEHAQTEIYFGA